MCLPWNLSMRRLMPQQNVLHMDFTSMAHVSDIQILILIYV